jgi:hypothetical protein
LPATTYKLESFDPAVGGVHNGIGAAFIPEWPAIVRISATSDDSTAASPSAMLLGGYGRHMSAYTACMNNQCPLPLGRFASISR